MDKRKRYAVVAIAALLIIPAVVGMFRTGDIVDCDNPSPDRAHQCSALHCQKAFRDRQLARADAQISTLRVSYNFSDAPDRSVYYGTWVHEDRSVIARCELKGPTVVAIDFLDKMPQ